MKSSVCTDRPKHDTTLQFIPSTTTARRRQQERSQQSICDDNNNKRCTEIISDLAEDVGDNNPSGINLQLSFF